MYNFSNGLLKVDYESCSEKNDKKENFNIESKEKKLNKEKNSNKNLEDNNNKEYVSKDDSSSDMKI